MTHASPAALLAQALLDQVNVGAPMVLPGTHVLVESSAGLSLSPALRSPRRSSYRNQPPI